jgi:hypothetical protein
MVHGNVPQNPLRRLRHRYESNGKGRRGERHRLAEEYETKKPEDGDDG